MAGLKKNSSEPFYLQIYRSLLAEIVSGAIPIGAKLPGMKLLAEQYNVSTITINLALNRLICDGYCIRRPKKGTFVNSRNSREERPRTGTIILFSETDNSEIDLVDTSFYTHLRQSTGRVSQFDLLVISGHRNYERMMRQLKENKNIIGVVFLTIFDLRLVLRAASEHPELQFVLLNYQFSGFANLAPENLKGVFNDEFNGGYMAALKLIADGARKTGVLFFGHASNENYNLRLKGFLQAHNDRGVPFDRNLIINIAELPTMQCGYDGMANLLSMRDNLDAVFCVNDLLAAGAQNFLSESKRLGTIRIMGYDNHNIELHISHHFSTIGIDFRTMTSAAINMILKPDEYPCRALHIPPMLISV